MKTGVRNIICAAALSSMLGCTTMSETSYSPRYVGVVGPGGDIGYLPRACLSDVGMRPGGFLPPGCANALNLLGMVADKRDLLQGREMGPAFVAPAAAAVERYLGGIQDDGPPDQQSTESGVSN